MQPSTVPGPTEAPRAQQGRIAALGGATIALVLGGSAFEILERRNEFVAQGARQASNLARALADHADRSIGEVSQALAAVAEPIARIDDLAGADEYMLHQMLRGRLRLVPQVKAAYVLDRNGRAVATSLYFPEQRIDLSDREYFVANRDAPAGGPFVGNLITSRTTGDKFVTISRRIEGTDRTFRGVIVGGLDPRYFSEIYGSYEIGARGKISLVLAAGNVVARMPFDEAALGGKMHAFETIARPIAANRSAVILDSPGDDGVPRILAARRAEKAPVIAVVALARDEILAPWRRDAFWQAAAALVASAVVLLLTLLVLRHIGRLRRSETHLRERSALLRSVFESLGEGVVVVDRGGRYAAVNPAAERILGRSAPELVGQRVGGTALYAPGGHTALAPEDRPLARLARGESGTAEYLVQRPDGSEHRRVAITTQKLAGDAGAVAVLRDETDKRKLEELLHRAQRIEALGKLTGGVAHDFNNLLLVIIGSTEALVQSLADRPDLRRHADTAMKAADRAAELTRQLLAFGRRQTLVPTNVDVSQLVGRMAGMLGRVLGANIAVELQLDPAAGAARADAAQIEVAVINLAANARDAMPKGGTLTIATREVVIGNEEAARIPDASPGRYVLIAVSDTGTGMAPEVAERAFEPFFTTKPVGAGTGLGLSSVYGFVTQSGGHIRLESEPGRGTTVRLYLPSADSTAAPAAAATDAPLRRGRGETILLVEDDAAIRAFALERLRALGYNVVEAEDARMALDILTAGAAVDLLFTDILMPGAMNGTELADAARAVRPDLGVLFTSGYADKSLGAGALRDAKVLSKPYRHAALAAAVAEALQRGRSA